MNRMFTILALAAIGCGVDAEESQLLAGEASPLPQPMTLTIANPLVAGAGLQAQITGAQPGANLLLIRSTGTVGAGGCPAPLNGGCLDITPGNSGYIVQAQLTANASGQVQFNPTVPATIPTGFPVALQVVAVSAGVGSNPVARLVTDPNACVDDGFEDNDTAATRTNNPAVPLTATVCDADDDFYGFAVPAGSVITIDTAFDHAGDGDVDMTLFSSSGTVLDSSGSTSNAESVSWYNNTGATVFVAAEVFLFGDNGGLAGAAYSLNKTLSTPVACVEDGNEDNDSSTATTPIATNSATTLSLCSGDDDWFSFTLAPATGVELTLDHDATDGTAGFAVYDSTLALLGTATTFNGTTSLSVSSTAGGAYYVETYLVSDDAVNLGIDATLTSASFQIGVCPVDAYEPNESLATAVALPLGLTTDLGACGVGGVDWYSIALDAGDVLDVDLYFTDADADVDLFVRNSQPATETYSAYATGALVSSTSTSDNESITYTATTAGTYYVIARVYAEGGGPTIDGAIYDMDVTVTP
jgi:hypothetical protein